MSAAETDWRDAGRVKLPIIVMTLKGEMETAVRAMNGGAVDFIEKRFDDDKLLDAINEGMAMETRACLRVWEPVLPPRQFGWRYWRSWRMPMMDRRPSIRRAT